MENQNEPQPAPSPEAVIKTLDALLAALAFIGSASGNVVHSGLEILKCGEDEAKRLAALSAHFHALGRLNSANKQALDLVLSLADEGAESGLKVHVVKVEPAATTGGNN